MRARLGLRCLSLLLLAAFVASCGGSSRSTTTSTTRAPFVVLIGAGRDLLRQGNLSAAEQLFQQAVARDPSNPVGYYDLGVVLQALGDRHGALRQYRLAVAHDPQYTPALFNEAVMLTHRDPELAIFYYRRILAIKPDAPTALLNLALLEAGTGYPSRIVLPSLRRALALEPSLRDDVPVALRHALAHAATRPPKSSR